MIKESKYSTVVSFNFTVQHDGDDPTITEMNLAFHDALEEYGLDQAEFELSDRVENGPPSHWRDTRHGQY